MALQRASLAAVGGKQRACSTGATINAFAFIRRLMIAAAALFVASFSVSATFAQSGPFAGMAGNWSGSGAVTLDDGSTERIRCRATYGVGAGGNALNLTLICASDAYKFDLRSEVAATGGTLSGTWSEGS